MAIERCNEKYVGRMVEKAAEETANPNIALKIMEDFREKLMSMGYIADRAPFGWEKVFSLTSKKTSTSRIIKDHPILVMVFWIT